MIWGPFALAMALGLIVAAGLYTAYLWPEDDSLVEPDDSPDEPASPSVARAGNASDTSS